MAYVGGNVSFYSLTCYITLQQTMDDYGLCGNSYSGIKGGMN